MKYNYFPRGSYHEHPVKILHYSFKNIWLLIFPLLRSINLTIRPFSFKTMIDWSAFISLDVVFALIMIGIGILRWYVCSYRVDSNYIFANSGVILRQEVEIPYDKITATIEEYPIYLKPLHAARLKISTYSENLTEDANLSITLRIRDLEQLRHHLPILTIKQGTAISYHTRVWEILVFSALFSSSFSGAVYLATLFLRGRSIFNDVVEELRPQMILEEAADKASSIFVKVPHTALILGLVVLFLWLLSFLKNLFHYAGFRVRFGKKFISIHNGLITRQRHHLSKEDIIFPDLQQNLILKLFGIFSLHIRCPGYGNTKDSLPVILPVVKKRGFEEMLKQLHIRPKPKHSDLIVTSSIQYIWTYVWPSVIGLLALPVVYYLGIWIVPSFEDVIHFLTMMLIIPLLWYAIVRLNALYTEYVAIEGEYVQLHFLRFTTFHTITLRWSDIVRIDIQQTPFQQPYKVCHLVFVCKGSTSIRYRVLAISEEKACKIIQTFVEKQ